MYTRGRLGVGLAGGKNALRGICGTKHPPEIFTGRRRNRQRIWRKNHAMQFYDHQLSFNSKPLRRFYLFNLLKPISMFWKI
jgi:hypothetical protein